MTLNDLTVNFEHLDRHAILEDWEWLIGKSKLPILLTAAGDAFLQDTEDGTVHMLDVGTNTVGLVAESVDEFEALLSDRNFVGEYFNVQIIGDLRLKGLILEAGQIYSFIKPPTLGGRYELDNFEITDIAVHFSITGQIGRQVKDLPPGTPIKGITLEEKPAPKSRWKFWQ